MKHTQRTTYTHRWTWMRNTQTHQTDDVSNYQSAVSLFVLFYHIAHRVCRIEMICAFWAYNALAECRCCFCMHHMARFFRTHTHALYFIHDFSSTLSGTEAPTQATTRLAHSHRRRYTPAPSSTYGYHRCCRLRLARIYVHARARTRHARIKQFACVDIGTTGEHREGCIPRRDASCVQYTYTEGVCLCASACSCVLCVFMRPCFVRMQAATATVTIAAAAAFVVFLIRID